MRNRTFVVFACIIALAAACGSSGAGNPTPAGPTPAGVVETVNAGWLDDAARFAGRNGQRFAYVCPPGPTELGTIWGTDLYTDDASVCVAAVHAGVLTRERGGVAFIEIRPGAEAYVGSDRNGVVSRDYPQWTGSYVFVR